MRLYDPVEGACRSDRVDQEVITGGDIKSRFAACQSGRDQKRLEKKIATDYNEADSEEINLILCKLESDFDQIQAVTI